MLVDMNIMEMKFGINDIELGVAFDNIVKDQYVFSLSVHGVCQVQIL